MVAGARAADAVPARVGRALEQAVEGREATRALAADALAVHLLQAEDVGVEALELGPQDGNPGAQRRFEARPVVEILEVEGGEPKAQGMLPEQGRKRMQAQETPGCNGCT